MQRLFILFILICLHPSWAHAEEADLFDLDLEALLNIQLTSSIPLGLHHTHPRGKWMLGYRYLNMRMSGNLDGTDSVSSATIVDPAGLDYMVAAESMDMEMHMFSLMYGLTNKLTIMGMLPYKRLSMDHITRSGINFTTRAEGIGDLSISGMYDVYQTNNHQFHFTAGLSLPTGSIDRKDNTPASGSIKVQLPYPMQLGSGTIDLLTGLAYIGIDKDWGWGADVNTTIRLGENDNDYSLGNKIMARMWVSRSMNKHVSLNFKLQGEKWGNIDGDDPALLPSVTVIPTADPDLRAGKRIDASIGLTLYEGAGRHESNRLAIEYAAPVYQSLDGPQLETGRMISFAWQYAY